MPFTPRRVLGRFTGTAKSDPLTTPKHKISIRIVHIPPTPIKNRQVRYVHQQALQQAKDPILCSLIDKLANAAIGSLVKEYLGEDRAQLVTILIFLTTPITLLLGWSFTYFVGRRSFLTTSYVFKALAFPSCFLTSEDTDNSIR